MGMRNTIKELGVGALLEEELIAIKALEALKDPALSLNDHSSKKDMPTREQSDAIWIAIANNMLPEELVVKWVTWIAKDVVTNVIQNKSSQRADRALKALKLSGRNNSDRDDVILQNEVFQAYALFRFNKAISFLTQYAADAENISKSAEAENLNTKNKKSKSKKKNQIPISEIHKLVLKHAHSKSSIHELKGRELEHRIRREIKKLEVIKFAKS